MMLLGVNIVHILCSDIKLGTWSMVASSRFANCILLSNGRPTGSRRESQNDHSVEIETYAKNGAC